MKVAIIWVVIIAFSVVFRYLTGSISVHAFIFDTVLISASVAGAWLAKAK